MKCLPTSPVSFSCHFSIASNNSVAWTPCQLLMYSTLSTVQKSSHILLFSLFLSPTHIHMPVLILFMSNCFAYFWVLFLYVALFERSLLAISSVSYWVILYLCFQCVFFIILSLSLSLTRAHMHICYVISLLSTSHRGVSWQKAESMYVSLINKCLVSQTWYLINGYWMIERIQSSG